MHLGQANFHPDCARGFCSEKPFWASRPLQILQRSCGGACAEIADFACRRLAGLPRRSSPKRDSLTCQATARSLLQASESWSAFAKRALRAQLRRDRLRRDSWLAKTKLARGQGERSLEAAGVEPASESTPSRASTCVVALESSQPPSKNDGNRRPLAPNCLAATRRNSPWRPARFYDIQSHPAGAVGVDVADLRFS